MIKLTKREYLAAIKRINKRYDKIIKREIHSCGSGSMLQAIQRDKNRELLRITKAYYGQEMTREDEN